MLRHLSWSAVLPGCPSGCGVPSPFSATPFAATASAWRLHNHRPLVSCSDHGPHHGRATAVSGSGSTVSGSALHNLQACHPVNAAAVMECLPDRSDDEHTNARHRRHSNSLGVLYHASTRSGLLLDAGSARWHPRNASNKSLPPSSSPGHSALGPPRDQNPKPWRSPAQRRRRAPPPP